MDHDGITAPGARVLVYGWYGHGNVGDESYRTSFPMLWPRLRLTFTDTLKGINQDDYDTILVGGGNILDHNFLGGVQKAVASGWAKPIHAFSVGSTDSAITLADLEPVHQIWARDNHTVQHLQTLGYNRVTYCPDAAFALTPDPQRGLALWQNLYQHHDLYDHKIIITINGHLLGSQTSLAREAAHFQTLLYDLAQLIDDMNTSCLFIPFGCNLPWDDRVANGCVATKCKWSGKLVTINHTVSAQATLDLIAAANLIISTRYHATIFALRSCTPFIDIYHHDKNKGLLQTVNYIDWGVPYWEFQVSKIRHLITHLILHQPEARSRLEHTQAALQQQLSEGAHNVCFAQSAERDHGH